MKLFGNKLEKLFKSEEKIIREQSHKPIETVEDLENLYEELGEDVLQTDRYEQYTRKHEELLDNEKQWDDDYWQNNFDPEKQKTNDVHEAEAILAGNDETVALDEWGLHDIIGGGKTQRKIDAIRMELDAYPDAKDDQIPVIENENPHTPWEQLSNKDKERDRNISKKYREQVEKIKLEQTKSTPESKPEISINLEQQKQQEKMQSDVERFKLLKEVLTYNRLVKENPNIEKLRPKRGDVPLSREQVEMEMANFWKKDEDQISKLERDYQEQCRAWIWAVDKIEGFSDNPPKDTNGKILNDAERLAMQKEYYDLKNNNPKEFARLNLEVVGEQKVAKGEWLKKEFVWKYNDFKGKDQWISDVVEDGKRVRYITMMDPREIADEGKSGNFFYKIYKEIPNSVGKTVIINIMLPRTDELKLEKTSR